MPLYESNAYTKLILTGQLSVTGSKSRIIDFGKLEIFAKMNDGLSAVKGTMLTARYSTNKKSLLNMVGGTSGQLPGNLIPLVRVMRAHKNIKIKDILRSLFADLNESRFFCVLDLDMFMNTSRQTLKIDERQQTLNE